MKFLKWILIAGATLLVLVATAAAIPGPWALETAPGAVAAPLTIAGNGQIYNPGLRRMARLDLRCEAATAPRPDRSGSAVDEEG